MKRKRPFVSEWFRGVLTAGVLVPARGCTRRICDVQTLDLRYVREGHRVLVANIGDRLQLHGESAEQIQAATVTAIKQSSYVDTYYLSLGSGGVNDGEVSVLRLCRRAG